MMRKLWKPIAFGLVLAAVVHVMAILVLPNVVMSIAVKRISATAGGMNRLFHSPLVTPQSQTIVRSSPDLAYSTCALDLSDGPVEVFVGKGSDYASIALYGANTDNVFALNDRDIGANGARLIIATTPTPKLAVPGAQVVTLPTEKGLVLIRRLAPSAQAFERVELERAGDRCGVIILP